MGKSRAKEDYTYCTNKECKNRKKCWRCEDNYEFEKEILYSFALFDENSCKKFDKN